MERNLPKVVAGSATGSALFEALFEVGLLDLTSGNLH